MERITKWAFRNKAAIIVSVVLVLMLGLYSYFTLPKELLPIADEPTVTVTVMGNGFDAATLLDQVTKPIEQAVGSVKGKTEVLSTSTDGYTTVTINFDSKTNMKDAKTEVQDAISGITLPQGVSRPVISQLNTSEIPIADVALTFANGVTQQNIDTVKNKIVPMFQDIPGVANAGVYGDNETEVTVHVDKTKMATHHVSLEAIINVLKGQNMAAAVATETINGEASSVTVVGNIDTLSKLENLPVAPHTSLKNVATVSASRNSDTLTHVNGKDGVLIFIQKNGSANAVSVGKQVKQVADQVNKDYSPAVHASVPFATATMVLNSVNSMMREVLMGALFATIVILLFLRSIRMTAVTIVSIPLSLGLTLFLLSETGITLNILTLGAMAVAVGRLVDDSIVVIENSYRKSQIEGASRETIVQATKEVATAITSSTLTTIAVFLPIGLVQGTLQELLFPFAMTVVYSLISSLAVALTVVPLMSAGMLKSAKLKEHRPSKRYTNVLTWVLNHKVITSTLTLLIFFGAIGAYFAMPKAALDTSDSTDITVNLNYPSTTPVKNVRAAAEQLEKYIVAQPQVENSLLVMGNNDTSATYGEMTPPTQAQFTVIMKDGANADDFVKHVNSQKGNYPTADLSAMAEQSFTGTNTITLDVTGNDQTKLLSVANQVMHKVQGITGVQKVSTNDQDVKPTYEIDVKPGVANAAQVATQLQAVLNPVPLGTMNYNGKDTTVMLDSTVNPTSAPDLSNILIASGAGVEPLSHIATIKKIEKPSTIYQKDGNTFVQVSVQVDPKKLSTIQKQINQQTATLKLPTGVALSSGGAAADMSSQFTDLAKAMLVAIGIVYLIMVLTFKTLRTPLAILFTLPLAVVGAVLGLIVTNTPADSSAMIGMLMLIGIVVTNAIVLLDKVKQNERSMTIREAIVTAAQTRVRPILMTATATICAMLPLVMSKAEMGSIVSKSLAIVVIGGLAVATLLTLVVIPMVYELLHFKTSKLQRKARQTPSATM